MAFRASMRNWRTTLWGRQDIHHCGRAMALGKWRQAAISLRESVAIIMRQVWVLPPTTDTARGFVFAALPTMPTVLLGISLRPPLPRPALPTFRGLLKCFWTRRAQQRCNRNKRAVQPPAPHRNPFVSRQGRAQRPCPLKRERAVEKAAARQGLRVRGNANNANCSARNVNSNNLASNCNANNSGSAQNAEKPCRRGQEYRKLQDKAAKKRKRGCRQRRLRCR